MLDSNATHVIQILYEYFQDLRVRISDIVTNNTHILITNKKGSQLVEKIFKNNF